MRTTNEPITPDDIDTSRQFWDSFGSLDAEQSANWIVTFCQERGTWDPFSIEELEAFYCRQGFKNFKFNGLDNGRHIKIEDGICTVTHLFVATCYAAAATATPSQPGDKVATLIAAVRQYFLEHDEVPAGSGTNADWMNLYTAAKAFVLAVDASSRLADLKPGLTIDDYLIDFILLDDTTCFELVVGDVACTAREKLIRVLVEYIVVTLGADDEIAAEESRRSELAARLNHEARAKRAALGNATIL